jgi:hypothetical protein
MLLYHFLFMLAQFLPGNFLIRSARWSRYRQPAAIAGPEKPATEGALRPKYGFSEPHHIAKGPLITVARIKNVSARTHKSSLIGAA